MSDGPAHLDELIDLADAGFCGALTADRAARLDALLRQSPQVRAAYLDLLLDAAAIRRWASQPHSKLETRNPGRPAVSVPADARPAFRIPRWAYALAAALLLAAGGLAIYLVAFDAEPEAKRSPAAVPFATLIESSADIAIADQPGREGERYPAGPVSIDSGAAELLVSNGAAIHLSGPTLLTLIDPLRVELAHGRAMFDCPPRAHGFTVVLPGGVRVIDRGTRFVVAVGPTGDADVAVAEGRVEVVSPHGRAMPLGERQLLRIDRAAASRGGAAADALTLIPAVDRLSLWLDASVGVETDADGRVVRWSGVATQPEGEPLAGEQPDAALRPTLVDRVVAGRPAIRFGDRAGTFLALPTAGRLGMTGGDYEAFIVARGEGEGVQFLLGGPAGHYELHLNQPGDDAGARFIPTVAAVAESSHFADAGTHGGYVGEPHVFAVRVERGVGRIEVDGEAGRTPVADAGSSVDAALRLGLRGDGSFGLRGEIAELMVYDAPLTDEQRAQVARYLMTRYRIAPPSRGPQGP